DIGMTNGGGLRADLPAGPLAEGALFQAFPFDNRLALLHMKGASLRRLLERNLAGEHGILSFSGIAVTATCEGRTLHASIALPGGSPISDDAVYTVATSDFLAQGGDDFATGGGGDPPLSEGAPRIDEEGPLMRDLVADELRRHAPVIAGDLVF